jgi:hypothetical protein
VRGVTAERGEEDVVLSGEVLARVVAIGLIRVRAGIVWNMVPASFWARTRHRMLGGV